MRPTFKRYVEFYSFKGEPKLVKELPSSHSRTGFIYTVEDRCDVCDAEGVVIAMDSSEGEHGPLQICGQCVTKAVKNRHS